MLVQFNVIAPSWSFPITFRNPVVFGANSICPPAFEADIWFASISKLSAVTLPPVIVPVAVTLVNPASEATVAPEPIDVLPIVGALYPAGTVAQVKPPLLPDCLKEIPRYFQHLKYIIYLL